MVHALETIRSSLRPQGILLDVRPASEKAVVEIAHREAADRPEHLVRIGDVDELFCVGTLADADAALGAEIEAGLFVREHARAFTFTYHFDSVEAWLAYTAARWSTARIGSDLIARAHAEWSGATDELLLRRIISAARLRRR
jgi:hypothetical protein